MFAYESGEKNYNNNKNGPKVAKTQRSTCSFQCKHFVWK